MKKVFKYISIIPCYIFLVIEGFIGGTLKQKDIWDDLVTWANK